MRPPIRLAILEADTPLDRARAKYGGYGGVFKALLRAAAATSTTTTTTTVPDEDLGGRDLRIIMMDPQTGLEVEVDVEVSVWNVEEHPERYPDLEDTDAILITGSKHNSFDDTPFILTLVKYTAKALDHDRVRVIGVCFGHQIVARAMGVKVGRNEHGWESSVSRVNLTPKGQELFRQDTLSIHQMHRDIVFYYPQGVEQLGSSPLCEVQGMYAEKRLLTVQGHPEFNGEIMAELLERRHKLGIFDHVTYKAAMDRSQLHHDGVAVGKAFLRFLLE